MSTKAGQAQFDLLPFEGEPLRQFGRRHGISPGGSQRRAMLNGRVADGEVGVHYSVSSLPAAVSRTDEARSSWSPLNPNPAALKSPSLPTRAQGPERIRRRCA